MHLTAKARRAHWCSGGDGWVCDACGDDNEEGLCMRTTGRVTRSDPMGKRVVCLCYVCIDRILHGVFVDQ